MRLASACWVLPLRLTLIQDTRSTPFNIGRRIELRDFTEAEAAPLAEGLRRSARGLERAAA